MVALSKFGLSVGALLLVVLVISTGLLFNTNEGEYISPISNIKSENNSYVGSINASISMSNYTILKGESLKFDLFIDVSDEVIELRSINLKVLQNVRSAAQIVQINETLKPGEHTISVVFVPYFTISGFIALNYGVFKLVSFTLQYKQRNEENKNFFQINKPLTVIDWPEFEQLDKLKWEEDLIDTQISYELGSPMNISIISNKDSASAVLSVNVSTTAYNLLEFNITNAIQSTVVAEIGDIILSSSDINSIGLGNIDGFKILKFSVIIRDNEDIQISVSMKTKRVTIFTVTANNNWESNSIDNLPFDEPKFYIEQVSKRYENTFNMSFIEVKRVDFISNTNTSLFSLINQAQNAVGKELGLTNSTWYAGIGPQSRNKGIDILLVFTNKTMEHLGIVIGSNGSAYNIAVQARGSTFEGNFRISSSLADNLLQHEMSHIFGAPDRWTYIDEASIMTKSRPEDGFVDIATGKFWLLQSRWLTEDISSIREKLKIFDL